MPRCEKVHNFRTLTRSVVPRPGVEPGLEVPETSVMSFSLPGRKQKQAIPYAIAADKVSDFSNALTRPEDGPASP